MEIKHTMTGNEISYAVEELKLLIKRRKDLIYRLQDKVYEQEKIEFELQSKTWKDPDDETEVSPEAYDLAKEVMNKDVNGILSEEIK